MRSVLLLCLVSCGYSARNNELIGQVKKVIEQTPLVCGDYVEADISLGVMRNGVGSMSREDVIVYVGRQADTATLKSAAETGALVKLTYDRQRWDPCVPLDWITHVEVLVTPEAPK